MDMNSGPQTKAELQTALDTVLQQAHANGVLVDNGGYALHHDTPAIPDWEIHITRITKPTTND